MVETIVINPVKEGLRKELASVAGEMDDDGKGGVQEDDLLALMDSAS